MRSTREEREQWDYYDPADDEFDPRRSAGGMTTAPLNQKPHDNLTQALRQCQRVLADMTNTDLVGKVSNMQMYMRCVEAEAVARRVLNEIANDHS